MTDFQADFSAAAMLDLCDGRGLSERRDAVKAAFDTAQSVPTTRLNNGATVLAKMYKGELWAVTFSNRTQAQNAAARTDGEVCQFMGRPFYVRFA